MSDTTSTGAERADRLAATEKLWKFRLGDDWLPLESAADFTATYCTFFNSRPASEDHLTAIAVKQRDAKGDGLSRFQDDDEDEDDANDAVQRSIGLQPEADALSLLNKTKSPHIQRMFRRLHEDLKQDSGSEGDFGGQVERIYLEYCRGGNLADLMSFVARGGLGDRKTFSEEIVWEIFHGLALACSVCRRGTEDMRQTAWSHEIVHLDITPRNVLFGDYESEESTLPVLKLSNFNCAIDVSRYPENDPEERVSNLENDYNATSNYDTLGLYPPEMGLRVDSTRVPPNNKRLGSEANTWQVGMIIKSLIELAASDEDSSTDTSLASSSGESSSGESSSGVSKAAASDTEASDVVASSSGSTDSETHLTISKKLDRLGLYRYPFPEIFNNKGHRRAYSQELIALIVECLLVEPEDRPSSKELQRRTQSGLRKSRGRSGKSTLRGIPPFQNCLDGRQGDIPPPEWKKADDSAITLMFKVYAYDDMTPHKIYLFDLPQSMNMGMVKNTLEYKLIGKPWQRNSLVQHGQSWHVKSSRMRFLWEGSEWDDLDTIREMGLRDMDLVACFEEIPNLSFDWDDEKAQLARVEEYLARPPKKTEEFSEDESLGDDDSMSEDDF